MLNDDAHPKSSGSASLDLRRTMGPWRSSSPARRRLGCIARPIRAASDCRGMSRPPSSSIPWTGMEPPKRVLVSEPAEQAASEVFQRSSR